MSCQCFRPLYLLSDDPRALPLISSSDVFELLANERRRYVIYEVRNIDHIGLEELATIVAAREKGVAVDDVSSEQAHHVAVSLHHHELPKLREARLINYDERQRDIRSGSNFSLVEKYLDIAAEYDGID